MTRCTQAYHACDRCNPTFAVAIRSRLRRHHGPSTCTPRGEVAASTFHRARGKRWSSFATLSAEFRAAARIVCTACRTSPRLARRTCECQCHETKSYSAGPSFIRGAQHKPSTAKSKNRFVKGCSGRAGRKSKSRTTLVPEVRARSAA